MKNIKTLIIIYLFLFEKDIFAHNINDSILIHKNNIENGLVLPIYDLNRNWPKFNILDRMKHYNIHGVSLAVIDKGIVSWTGSYGVKDTLSKQLITSNTLFQAGAISKVITTLGVLKLVSDKKLSLDNSVSDYLTSWKIPPNPYIKVEKPTLKRVLSHNGGFASVGLNDSSYDPKFPIPKLLQILNGESPSSNIKITIDHTPGVNPEVSSEGYCVIQQIIVDITKMDFKDFMQNTILSKIGMRQSTFKQILPRKSDYGIAYGHKKGKLLSARWKLHPAEASAGLWSTPTDIANAFIEIQSASLGKGKVISKELIMEMLSPQPNNTFRGLGIYLHGNNSNQVFYHRGWSEGYTCYGIAIKGTGQGAVIMTNSDTEGYKLIMEILKSISNEYNWPSDLPSEMASPRKVKSIALNLDSLKYYEGDYILEGKQIGTVYIENGSFYLKSNNKDSVILHPLSNTDFYLDDGRELIFAIENNKLTGLVFRDPFYNYYAKKIISR